MALQAFASFLLILVLCLYGIETCKPDTYVCKDVKGG